MLKCMLDLAAICCANIMNVAIASFEAPREVPIVLIWPGSHSC